MSWKTRPPWRSILKDKPGRGVYTPPASQSPYGEKKPPRLSRQPRRQSASARASAAEGETTAADAARSSKT